jgi:hypothetical protein
MAEQQRRCPDEGACHHECGRQPCFRVLFCVPLSAYGEHWRKEDVLAEAAREDDAHDYRI